MALAGMPIAACRPADAAADSDGALVRFRAGLVEPKHLTGAAPSLDVLIERFVRALETRDTGALVTLHLTRAEFAWLYYPTNPQARPPYNLAPDLMWFIENGNSEQGVQRLLEDRAGMPLGVLGYRCDPVTSRQGANTVIGPCVVRRATGGTTVDERLFGLVVEREGLYKFVSYANKL